MLIKIAFGVLFMTFYWNSELFIMKKKVMVKMYFFCCSYRTRIKDQGIIKLRIAGLDKQINYSTRICIPIADWDSKKVLV